MIKLTTHQEQEVSSIETHLEQWCSRLLEMNIEVCRHLRVGWVSGNEDEKLTNF